MTDIEKIQVCQAALLKGLHINVMGYALRLFKPGERVPLHDTSPEIPNYWMGLRTTLQRGNGETRTIYLGADSFGYSDLLIAFAELPDSEINRLKRRMS